MPVASSQTGSDVGGLTSYVASKAEAVDTQNLFGKTEREVKREMRLTVKHRSNPGGRPLEKPAYHISVSYDPEEEISDEEMLSDMRELLKRRGMGEHQAVLAVHRDKPHPHVHAAVNRVHPQTDELWRNTFDYDRNMEVLREIEQERGRMTPEEDPLRGRIADWKYQKEKRTGEKPFGTLVQEACGDEFAESETWEELQSRLAENGLTIRRKGSGGVVTDREEEAPLSEVARAWSFNKLNSRFSDQFQSYSHGFERRNEGERGGDGRGAKEGRGAEGGGQDAEGRGPDAEAEGQQDTGRPGKDDRAAQEVSQIDESSQGDERGVGQHPKSTERSRGSGDRDTAGEMEDQDPNRDVGGDSHDGGVDLSDVDRLDIEHAEPAVSPSGYGFERGGETEDEGGEESETGLSSTEQKGSESDRPDAGKGPQESRSGGSRPSGSKGGGVSQAGGHLSARGRRVSEMLLNGEHEQAVREWARMDDDQQREAWEQFGKDRQNRLRKAVEEQNQSSGQSGSQKRKSQDQSRGQSQGGGQGKDKDQGDQSKDQGKGQSQGGQRWGGGRGR